MNTDIDIRKEDDLAAAIGKADLLLNKKYLSILNTSLIDIPQDNEIENINKQIRFFDITQIVLNRNENMRDKLATLFNAVGNSGASILMLIKGTREKTSVYYGVKASDVDNLYISQSVLESNVKANFPGTKLLRCEDDLLQEVLNESFSPDGIVSSVSDIAGLRFDDETKDRQFMQGIEKLIDALQGKEYSLLLIADPVSLTDLNFSRKALEDLYSALVPFSESQLTIGINESDSINKSIAKSITDTVNESVTDTVTHTVGRTTTVTDGTNESISKKPLKTTLASAGGAVMGGLVGFCLGGPIGAIIGSGVGGKVGGIAGETAFGSSITNGTNHSVAQGTNELEAKAHAKTSGTAHSSGTTVTEGETHSSGSSRGMQIKSENHTVKQLLKRIDKTLERYDICGDVGMWNCAVYCISREDNVSSLVASTYRALIRGKNSSLENGTITSWDLNQSKLIIKSLKSLSHPMLNVANVKVTPGTLISSKELAIQAGLPNHSVPGVPVIECAEFGRTVVTNNIGKVRRNLGLGNIFNMHEEEAMSVMLDIDNLASHTFITGSTGSGKSNTVYQVLSQLRKRGISFLVIEPAKGEYKNVFGNIEDVKVYGTNPELTSLLRINPFSFPSSIHILEHLDRLIEIFNVCWPMYAAMPAVLKEAVEKSYEDCGWNLAESTNEYNCNYYPTFADVTRNIRTIIDSSEYDAENKGAYKGSLITRLKSLTNGINGLIFTTDEISDKELFDENVIVDLSRVGSTETKSLIMGLLVLKLQEYRMTSGKMNDSLRHVTVLEEAHNLLKRTSTEQSQDSGNLLGKSVEMLTNAIAEMRTYGEGFIIADQAPALLDMAVIRNTNTKIIMRLPDQDDRELVGKAASLNDDQIVELSKLPCGVAAVYQNEWIEPVLCKVAKYDFKEEPYRNPQPKDDYEIDNESRLEVAKLLCTGTAITGKSEEKDLKDKLNELSIKDSSKVWILKSVKASLASPRYTKLAPVISELFPELKAEYITSFNRTSDPMQWTDDVDAAIRQLLQQDIEENLLRSIRQSIITDYLYNELHKADLLEKWAATGGVK